ncbi:MAG: transcriptional repressor [Candidatus Eisenbacteria bacterium]|nr:transcriptional repressor [Candidatus Eisenbacteria bacterium]
MERSTAQRRAILKVIEEAGRPVGPGEIFEAARVLVPGLGIATVYRAIKQLIEGGHLAQVDLPGEPPRYEAAGKAHHHHFRCSLCRRVFELDRCGDSFQQFAPKGFHLDGHELYLFGRCRECTA